MKMLCPYCGQKYGDLPDEFLNKSLECASYCIESEIRMKERTC